MHGRIITGEAPGALAQIPAQSVDMCLTDLPYECTSNDWDKAIPVAPLWKELKRVMKPNGAILLFARGLYLAELMLAQPEAYKFKYIWLKNRVSNPHNAKVKPMENFEEIAVFCFGKLPYFPQKSTGHKPTNPATKKANSSRAFRQSKESHTPGGDTTRFPKTVLEFACVNNDSRDRVHTNQKPVKMLQHLIRQHSEPGAVVLDFCCGSGSTGVAAFTEKRDYILMDKGEEWTSHARGWLARLKGEKVTVSINITSGNMPLFETSARETIFE